MDQGRKKKAELFSAASGEERWRKRGGEGPSWGERNMQPVAQKAEATKKHGQVGYPGFNGRSTGSFAIGVGGERVLRT